MGDVFKELLRFLILLLVAIITSLCICLVSWKMSNQFVSKKELKPWDCSGPTSCEPVQRFPYETDAEMEDAFKQQFPFLVLLLLIVITTTCFCLVSWKKSNQTHPDRNGNRSQQ